MIALNIRIDNCCFIHSFIMDSHNSPPTSLRTTNEDEEEKVETKSRGQLPQDILGSIADCLGIIELLHFRCVCKDWYSASSSSSAQIQCFREPWFLLYGEKSQCTLFSTDSAKKYTLNLPELEDGATCIASESGWLLVIKNDSLYFFCPLSGAKLVLPELPIKDHWNYLAAFSSPPTSPDCTVCFFRQDRSSDSDELYVLARGATSWTKEVLSSMKESGFKTIKAASFNGDEVYLMDENDKLITYNVKKKDVEVLQIVDKKSRVTRSCPFYGVKKYLFGKKMEPQLGLRGRFSLTTCGTRLLSQKQSDTVVYGETINGFPLNEEDQSVTRNLKGVWIHPRFVRVSPSFQW